MLLVLTQPPPSVEPHRTADGICADCNEIKCKCDGTADTLESVPALTIDLVSSIFDDEDEY